MKNVDWRVVHHLLAHTVGQCKSTHGVVNNFENFYLYTIANWVRINMGYQIAKFYLDKPTILGQGEYIVGVISQSFLGAIEFSKNQKLIWVYLH